MCVGKLRCCGKHSPRDRISRLRPFLSSTRAPRDLHSFPTRRSSDLSAPSPRGPALAAGGRRATLASGLRNAAAINLRRGDRKSTRLNSSHTVISYAVFCLKKKRQLDVRGQTALLREAFSPRPNQSPETFSVLDPRPPRSTLFPYTTLFRSKRPQPPRTSPCRRRPARNPRFRPSQRSGH